VAAGPAARSRPTNRSVAFLSPSLPASALAIAASSLRSSAWRRRAAGLRLELQPGHDGGDQGRQVEVDREGRDADRAQGVDREQHRLGVGFGAVDADQLGADLGELALRLQRIAAHADHVAAVGQAQRPRLVLQPGHGDARDLHGHVGPHAHHALRHRVHQAEGLRGERGARSAEQRFLELDQRRLDPLVAEGRETLDGGVDRARLARRVGRQQVGEPGGKRPRWLLSLAVMVRVYPIVIRLPSDDRRCPPRPLRGGALLQRGGRAAGIPRARGRGARRIGGSSEIVVVDDGSRDGTWRVMTEASARDPRIVAVRLMRNHGHQLALTAGLSICRGERVLIIDADLQDPPELLPDMMAMIDGGADVVYGQRRARAGESLFKRVTAAAFYRLIGRMTDVDIPLDAGDFRLVTRRVLDMLLAMPERHRFIRGMVAWIGGRQVPIAYDRAPRAAGESKYPLSKMIRFAADAITAFSVVPLMASMTIGWIMAAVGFASSSIRSSAG
jgi:dolichol-phosphate mannosyltransferase